MICRSGRLQSLNLHVQRVEKLTPGLVAACEARLFGDLRVEPGTLFFQVGGILSGLALSLGALELSCELRVTSAKFGELLIEYLHGMEVRLPCAALLAQLCQPSLDHDLLLRQRRQSSDLSLSL